MNEVFIIAFVIGTLNIVMGCMRRYNGRLLLISPKFKDDSHKKIYSKLRCNFDICHGVIMIIWIGYNKLDNKIKVM